MPGNLGDVYTFQQLYDYYNQCAVPATKDAAVRMISNFFYNLGHCAGDAPYMQALETPEVLFQALSVVARKDVQTDL